VSGVKYGDGGQGGGEAVNSYEGASGQSGLFYIVLSYEPEPEL
jgi:hypothetical protein